MEGQFSVSLPPPSRPAGLQHLHSLSDVVRSYAVARNFAGGVTTSRLSPHLRRRLILEEEVLDFARTVGSFPKVEKFAQEVVWRTYWKGWLESRPHVWSAYLDRLRTLDDTLPVAQRERLVAATTGRTPLACFNDWCHELLSTGYLHNHVRMWFASIWIFTLRLPWELGARFFLEHLLDGDPASNTLSWRWVGGLQTPGKHYLARADNIARFTQGRWVPQPGDLDESASPLPDDGLARSAARKPLLGPAADSLTPPALLLHEEDCGPLPRSWSEVPAVRFVNTRPPHHQVSPLVAAWITHATTDADTRHIPVATARSADEVADWCRSCGWTELWTLRPHTGFVALALADLQASLASTGIRLQFADRAHDLLYFPLATRGFFPFWEAASAKLRRDWN